MVYLHNQNACLVYQKIKEDDHEKNTFILSKILSSDDGKTILEAQKTYSLDKKSTIAFPLAEFMVINFPIANL